MATDMMVADWQSLARMQVLADADYLNSVLDSLPGVNTSDPTLQDAVRGLEQLGKETPSKKDEDKKEDK